MRFHKGSMVEVFTKKKDPSGVWRCAQIVEDNGDSYTVRYYRFLGVAKEGVDKVPTDVVRPRPPSAASSALWTVGDVVEVLDDGYWRVSMIEEVLEDDSYHIQVIGSVDEFRVKKSSIRACQEWKGNQWVPMGMDVGIGEKLMSRMHMVHVQRLGDTACVMEAEEPILHSKKRRAGDNISTDKASLECAQKRRAVEKEVEFHNASDCYSFNRKVENSVNVGEIQSNDKMLVSKETTRVNNAKPRNQDIVRCPARTSTTDDCVSSKSSVASCSIIRDDAGLDRLVSHSLASCRKYADSLCSDAESVDHKGDDEVISIGQLQMEDTLRMHEKELHDYRRTLETLYACGPLSWDLEIYLTNLRQKYSVSTDEHLMELRRLKSTGSLVLRCY